MDDSWVSPLIQRWMTQRLAPELYPRSWRWMTQWLTPELDRLARDEWPSGWLLSLPKWPNGWLSSLPASLRMNDPTADSWVCLDDPMAVSRVCLPCSGWMTQLLTPESTRMTQGLTPKLACVAGDEWPNGWPLSLPEKPNSWVCPPSWRWMTQWLTPEFAWMAQWLTPEFACLSRDEWPNSGCRPVPSGTLQNAGTAANQFTWYIIRPPPPFGRHNSAFLGKVLRICPEGNTRQSAAIPALPLRLRSRQDVNFSKRFWNVTVPVVKGTVSLMWWVHDILVWPSEHVRWLKYPKDWEKNAHFDQTDTIKRVSQEKSVAQSKSTRSRNPS